MTEPGEIDDVNTEAAFILIKSSAPPDQEEVLTVDVDIVGFPTRDSVVNVLLEVVERVSGVSTRSYRALIKEVNRIAQQALEQLRADQEEIAERSEAAHQTMDKGESGE